MDWSALHLQQLGALGQLLSGRAPFGAPQQQVLQHFWQRLQLDEAKLMQLLDDQARPGVPGNAEFGWVLYGLNHPPKELAPLLDLLKALHVEIPPSRITPADVARWREVLQTIGVCSNEGDLIQEARYAALDPGWIYSLLLYLLYKLDLRDWQKAPCGNTPQTIRLVEDLSKPLGIALLGDWGTGRWQDGTDPDGPAVAVMNLAAQSGADLAIHLGDVYYAGTRSGLFDCGPGEEQSHLLDLWRTPPLGSFTLNSNHEMYDGGHGYFDVALSSPHFAQQKGTSYFALEHGNWLILGLDSAYSDPSHLYMDGAIDAAQVAFIRSLPLQGRRVIVLTHHNPIDYTGTSIVNQGQPNCLWQQVCDALGRPPEVWYWGHLHSGIAYSEHSVIGATTRGRCVGHGAFPFGLARGLLSHWNDPASAPIPSVAYFARTPLVNPTPQQLRRVRNGFATLTLQGDTLTEAFFEVGNLEPVWRETRQY